MSFGVLEIKQNEASEAGFRTMVEEQSGAKLEFLVLYFMA